ncbi:MAG TPA: methyltransferase domain-containing protein [Anaerolineae bacterium]|nr:methyltransferase domain-containing protein [Anaerolineae bacterium]
MVTAVSELEGEFYNYMHALDQVDETWNREVLGYYVSFFSQCSRVLDVGCGEGQFIELLQAEGVDAVGVDLDARMVEVCRQKGLDVVAADLFHYLPQHQGQFDGIFSSNLIEHLSAQDAVRFVRTAFEALRPGGRFLIATPNPASPIVHLHEFWRDATHIRLYTDSLLGFLFQWAGFEAIETGENPQTSWTPPEEMREVPQLLNKISAHRQRAQWNLALPQLAESGLEDEVSSWRRLVFSTRRRLARFLAQTVLFEEFAALNTTLSVKFAELAGLTATMQRIEQALYESQNGNLTRPREIFARGFRSPAVSEEQA